MFFMLQRTPDPSSCCETLQETWNTAEDEQRLLSASYCSDIKDCKQIFFQLQTGWRKRTRRVSPTYYVKCQIARITRMSWEDPCGTKCRRTGLSTLSRTAWLWGGGSHRIWPRQDQTRAQPRAATRPPRPTLRPRLRSRILSSGPVSTTWPRGRPRPPPRRCACPATRGRAPPPWTCRDSRPAASWCPAAAAPETTEVTGSASARGWTWNTTRWRTTAPPTGTSGAESTASSPAPAGRLPTQSQWPRPSRPSVQEAPKCSS